MDEAVLRAMLKWPDTPAVYGWLRLERRGAWRIRTGSGTDAPRYETIGNPALNEFIGRNYAPDEKGRWFFHNGPQRVYVTLAYAPFVFRLDAGGLADQCGARVAAVDGAWLDEEGSLVLRSAARVGVLDDRDLAAFADPLAEGFFPFRGECVPVGAVTRAGLGKRFGFVPDPRD
jgi:hypothetical protein